MATIEAVPWEYKVVTFQTPEIEILEKELSGWGAAGWELVSLTSTIKVWNVAVHPNSLVAVLKRPGVGVVDRNATPDPRASTEGWI